MDGELLSCARAELGALVPHRSIDVQEYMKLLEDSFNPVAGEKLMCRDTVNVSWDGSMCGAPVTAMHRPCDQY